MPVAPELLGRVLEELSAEAREAVLAEGVPAERVDVRREADLRFRRQQWEVTVPIPPGPPSAVSVAELEREFRRRYEALYGRGTALVAAGIDLVNCRAVGRGLAAEPDALAGPHPSVRAPNVPPRRKGRRRLAASLGEGVAQGPLLDVWDGEGMSAGAAVTGPAVIERRDTTIYVPGGMWAVVDELGSCVVQAVRRSAA
jgi:N-methylhydantoinase A